MKTLRTLLLVGALSFSLNPVRATQISLYEYAFNVDATVSQSGASINLAAFDTAIGLGSVLITLGTSGSHSILAFFDHSLDEDSNTYFNELGASIGTPSAGQSWEIDEPGSFDGDIYENFVANSLDRDIGVSIYGDTEFPDDVSMALGWDLLLSEGEIATIEFLLSETAPGSGFYLQQYDPDSAASIYFSSSLRIGGTSVPDGGPGMAGLLMVLAGLWGGRRFFRL